MACGGIHNILLAYAKRVRVAWNVASYHADMQLHTSVCVCDRSRGRGALGGAISCGGGPLVTVSGTAVCEDPSPPRSTIHLPTPGVAEKWRGSLADGGIYITHPPFQV